MTKVLKKAIKSIVDSANPDRIILFGSRARGAARKGSDYDFLVLKNKVSNKRKLGQKIYMNFDCIGAPVDLIVEETSVFENEKNVPYKIYNEINSSGAVVYEKRV
jgi:uncharacterized protein